ncbi:MULTISPECIES: hypothetical protein [Chromobacterium]|uniref:hypothetical protein n=1 Tax=Chromobacterium TaxID=535 RepID=UPI000D310077|nr:MULTISPECIES: hypothetical protein [Chromobacterium]MCP1289687.1 hypothetical protein [Chromobacterium sp. S0633]PTU66921.1 hypothetical protein DB032_19305 [Chromobacterium sp. Panama]UJB33247.1 hypothetical protein HQN78_20585 [Chromobacterium sp. Beijing]
MMNKVVLPALLAAVFSVGAHAADPIPGSTRASAEWDVTADKDSSHAIEITAKKPNVHFVYSPISKTIESKNLDFDIRMLNSDEYTISGYKVKASSVQHQLSHTASIGEMDFDLSVTDHAGKQVKLSAEPKDLDGLSGFGEFAKVASIAGENKGTSQLKAEFAGGKDSSGVMVTEASKLSDGQYVGKFDLILDASWQKTVKTEEENTQFSVR